MTFPREGGRAPDALRPVTLTRRYTRYAEGSVLGVEWEGAEDRENGSAISTQTLGEAVFASTIQASVSGSDVSDELDDAEIERSIKEINEAIKRSSQHRKS